MTKEVFPGTCRGVRRGERLTNCAGERRYTAFTLIELVLVVGIIAVLGALVLSTVGYARKKGARARAETEMAAMSAACENYKADNGVYPSNNPTHMDSDAQTSTRNPWRILSTICKMPVCICMINFSGTRTQIDPIPARSLYFTFKPNMLVRARPRLTDVLWQCTCDPFGNS